MQTFSSKCDMCGKVQVEEDASKITGTLFTMNGVSKHACGDCVTLLNGVFAAGAEGLKDPVKRIAEISKERDDALRQLEAIRQTSAGKMVTFEDMARQQRALQLSPPPGGGGIEIPRIGRQTPQAPRLEQAKKDNKGKDKRR